MTPSPPSSARAHRHPKSHDGEVLLTCDRLVVGWEGRGLLPPIDLELRRGCFVAVVGRNGAGKSTWFKTLLGLTPAVSGRVVKGRPDLRLAYVPQSSTIEPLLPLRALDVVLWGRLKDRQYWMPFAGRRDREAALRALEDAEALDLAERPFFDLSKGQRQRVLFARMLATEPDLALLDEPTAAMDVVAEQQAFEQLTRLAHERGITVVLVSHTLGVARYWADDVLLLDRNGPTVAFGTPDEVLQHPAFVRLYGTVIDDNVARPITHPPPPVEPSHPDAGDDV